MMQQETVLGDPGWFADSIDVSNNRVGFARITRQALAEEAFLDKRMAGSVSERCDLPLNELLRSHGKRQEKPIARYIVHSAFCCSTLLARALDHPGSALSLKEPDVLMGLANALRVNDSLKNSEQSSKQVSQLVFDLLARQFDANEKIVIKPTNTANNLLPMILDSGARVVLLHSDLRSFLISVLKKGEACKAFVRQQYNIFALDPNGLGAIAPRQAMGFTDLQVAAVVWRHQMELFSRALHSNPTNVIALDARTLMADPARVLANVANHFDLQFDSNHLGAVASGPIFSRNSKFSEQQYDAEQRTRESQEVEKQYRDVLDMIVQWAEQLSLGTKLEWPLPNSL